LSNLLQDAQNLHEQFRRWRRDLHAHPELSGQEEHTAAFLAAELRRLGYVPVERVGGTFGLAATLRVNDAPAVALRADMDALPVKEQTGLDFASTRPGVMHACGHDAHMAMLLGAAALLMKHRAELRRSVKLIFQPHEEKYPGGAASLIAAGIVDDVESVFGLHIWSQLPLGTLGTRCGPFMSSVNDLHVIIRGKGGHAAMPEQTIDPVVVAAHVITALQTVVSRSIALTDPAVVSITQISAGTADNIIPETAVLRGTIRTLSETVRQRVCARVRALAEGVAAAHGAVAEVDVLPGYPVLVNDEQVVQRVLRAARQVGFGDDVIQTMEPQGGGEDFAYYGQQVPAGFAFLGARNDAAGCHYPHHHPRFNIDEAALPLGAALLAQFALDAPKV